MATARMPCACSSSRRKRLEALEAARGEDEVAAVARDAAGQRLADAARRTRDECDCLRHALSPPARGTSPDATRVSQACAART